MCDYALRCGWDSIYSTYMPCTGPDESVVGWGAGMYCSVKSSVCPSWWSDWSGCLSFSTSLLQSASMETGGSITTVPTYSLETQSNSFYKSLNLIFSRQRPYAYDCMYSSLHHLLLTHLSEPWSIALDCFYLRQGRFSPAKLTALSFWSALMIIVWTLLFSEQMSWD